jgi:hypothetical protein
VDDGYAPKTVGLMLAVLRRVLALLHRAGRISRNPATRFGEVLRRADRRVASEVTVSILGAASLLARDRRAQGRVPRAQMGRHRL